MSHLAYVMRRVKYSSTRTKRFYSSRDMAEIKRYEALTQAKRNRGEIPNHNNAYIVQCSCGVEGCFIHNTYESVTPEAMVAWQNRIAEGKAWDQKDIDKEAAERKVRKAAKRKKLRAKQRK